MSKVSFEWDEDKDKLNEKKHRISFAQAQYAFLDPGRIIAEDIKHSGKEKRYFCIGLAGVGILTVRFTYRNKIIRIIGEGGR